MNSLLTLPTHTDLVATITHARALLDEGDLKAARTIAGIVYDQARAGAASAQKVKASRQLIEKAQRMQADALFVETMATIGIADAIDEAQAKGQISRGGRPKTVSGDDRFSLLDVGLDKQMLHSARKVRDAERMNPGFVLTLINARLAEGLAPSRAALKRAARGTVGMKSATKAERGAELYETPIEAIRTLLALESFSSTVLEPSVGRGAILRPLEAAGYQVRISDLVDRDVYTSEGKHQGIGDFLDSVGLQLQGVDHGADIVTNPPFGIANAYAAHALRQHKPRKMALLLNLNFMCGFDDPNRLFVMEEYPPSRVYAFSRRLPMMHREGYEGPKADSQMNCGWFVWVRNDDGSYGTPGRFETIRVNYSAYEEAVPLLPGAGGHVPPLTFLPSDEFARQTPRRSVDECCAESIDAAIDYATGRDWISEKALRQHLAVRPQTGEALVERLIELGMFHRPADANARFWAAHVCEAAA